MQSAFGINVTNLPPLRTWEDFAALSSIFGLILVLATIAVAGAQAIIQMRQFGRERAFDSYFRFTKTFSDISHDFHKAKVRFRQHDKTLDEAAAENYYRRYWHLQLQQWELLTAGLMPRKIYAIWMLYALDYFSKGRDFEYYDDAGVPRVMTFCDAFDRIGKRVLRNQERCLRFFGDLKSISCASNDRGHSAIKDLVQNLASERRLGDRWRLN
jgi:hypothetical protein